MKNMLIMIVTLFVLGVSLTSHAGSERTERFVGLWEGVDPEDGALQVLSVTDNNDGTVKLLLYATFWTRCDGERGIAQATAKVSEDQSLKSDDYVITCFKTDETVDIEVEVITLTLNSDETLTEDRSALDAPSVTYHRVSK